MESVNKNKSFIDLYMHLAKLLFHNGATVQRVIDTIGYMKNYLGGDDIHVIIDYDGIVITDINGQRFHTKVERRQAFVGLNAAILIETSNFMHRLHADKPTVQEIKDRLALIESMRSPLQHFKQHIVVGLVAVGFGGVNGADLLGIAAIFPAAIILSIIKQWLTRIKFNQFMAILLAGICGVTISGAISANIATNTALIVLMAVLLPQVPGCPLINAGIDILHNHNGVGLGRLAFATMQLIALALAACVPLLVFFNSAQVDATSLAPFAKQVMDMLYAALAAMGLGLLFNVPLRFIIFLAVGGLLARGVRTEMIVHWQFDMATAAFCGALCASLLASVAARRMHFPTAIFAMICVLPMIPGFLVIDGFNNLFLLSKLPVTAVNFEFVAATLQTLLKGGFTVFALIFGVIFPVFLLEGRSLRI